MAKRGLTLGGWPADQGPEIDLYGLLRSLKSQGLQTPCLFRFPDIVNHRVARLHECFDKAINRYEYQACHVVVQPSAIGFGVRFQCSKDYSFETDLEHQCCNS